VGLTVQHTPTNGKILATDNGKIMGECCCNPCTNDCPPLAVTVSWVGNPPELTGGTYSWLGEDFENGDTKYICPDSCSCTYGAGTIFGTTYFFGGGFCFRNKTTYYTMYINDWAITDLVLEGQYLNQKQFQTYGTHTNYTTCNFTNTTTIYFGSVWYKRITVDPLGTPTLSMTRKILGGTASSTVSNTTGLSTENITNASNFSISTPPVYIDSQLEGQLTTNSGVTIAWERAVLPDWCGQ